VRGIRILFLTQICPYPPTNGGAIKTFNILKHLGSAHDVRLLMLVRQEPDAATLERLARHCREIGFCGIRRSAARNALDAARSLWKRESFIITRDFRPQMQAKVLEALAETPFDLIYVDHLQMFQYVPGEAPCPVLLDEHNVEWQIIERFAVAGRALAQRAFASLEWRKLRAYELSACRRADIVLTVTDLDRRTIALHGIPEGKISAVPIGVDVDMVRPVQLSASSANVLTFGTMSWPPNADSVEYFASEIYPRIKKEVPEARFTVVGANPPSRIGALGAGDRSIQITGFVEDLREPASEAAAFVVPLRIGSGMRVKILDAMALGLPVVTSSIGCEGINVESGKHALVADTPEEFAEAVVHLLRNPEDRRRFGAAGRALVESVYSWPLVLSRLDQVLARVERL
jgi:glycosyltransferase involved in cell wall biosynthesis